MTDGCIAEPKPDFLALSNSRFNFSESNLESYPVVAVLEDLFSKNDHTDF